MYGTLLKKKLVIAKVRIATQHDGLQEAILKYQDDGLALQTIYRTVDAVLLPMS